MADGWDIDGWDNFAADDAPGDTEDADGDGDVDWACLTEADLEADLMECEEELASEAAAPKLSAAGRDSAEEKLRAALQRSAAARGVQGSLAAPDADVFFAAPQALRGVAAELQELLANLDALRFEAASLTASLAHGPLCPHGESGGATAVPADVSEWVGRPADEVFGFSEHAPKPPPLELSLPSAAASFPDYQKRLEVLPRVFYLERKVRLCMGEVDKYQDGKDISRDELVVNGHPVSGAKGGYAAAVDALASGVRAAAAGGTAAGLAAPAAAERGAQLLLSVLNRTSSGFAAFEEVLRAFDCLDAVIVSPDSAAARPLEAAVLGGLVRGGALGRAHTRYAVRGAAGDGEPLAVIDAEFSFRVPFPLLGELVAVEPRGAAWPSKEITAAVLLRWS